MTAAGPHIPRCGARTRSGGRCQQEAGWGTDHVGVGACRFHAGSTPTGRKAGALALARAEAGAMGAPIELHPHDALLLAVYIKRAEVEFYSRKIAEVDEGELVDRGVVSVWVSQRDRAVDGMARYAKSALDAGVDERRVQIAESQAERLAAVLNAVMADLAAAGLPGKLKRLAGESFRRHVALIDAAPDSVPEVTA